MKRLPTILKRLFTLIFIDQIYLTATFPLVTLIFFDTHSRLFAPATPLAERSIYFGSCVALPNFINLICAPLLGILSDEIGRKKILLIEIAGGFFYTLLLGLGVFFGALPLIFLGFIMRGAFARTNPTALAIVGDSVSAKDKVYYMGLLQFAISLGAMVGPILGGFFAVKYHFDYFNYALPFFLAAALASCNLMISFATIQETLPAHDSTATHTLKKLQIVLKQPNVLRLSLLLLLVQTSWSIYYQFIPPILKAHYQYNANQLGWFIGMIAAWLTLTTGWGIRWLTRHFNIAQLLIFSCSLILLGYVLTGIALSLPVSDWPFLIWIAAAPIAAGDVIAYSCITALYSNAVSPAMQGKIMGMSFIIVGLVWSSMSFLGGYLMSQFIYLPLMLAPIGALTALTLVKFRFGQRLTHPKAATII